MTFCLGMKCQDGLLAIADTRITSGNEISTAKKVSVHQIAHHSMFILTSGLRSLRDKSITYFEQRLSQDHTGIQQMYQAANAFADEVRKVRSEDAQWLISSNLSFDLHCIIGGQLEQDDEPHMFLVYPEGNWVEVRTGTPYVIIGDTRYGKPILDRLWRFDRTLHDALRIGLIAFNETKTSASNVDYPADAVLYRPGSFEIKEARFSAEDLAPMDRKWGEAIEAASNQMSEVTRQYFQELDSAPPAATHFGDTQWAARGVSWP
jgi:putative proteasome-type protease